MIRNLYASFRQSPDEDSFDINVTSGCSYNECAFCALYRDKEYGVVRFDEIARTIRKIPREDLEEIPAIYLGEGNALAAGPAHLKKILKLLGETFPVMPRVGISATVQDVMKKKPRDLKELKVAGLRTVYMGVESGDKASLAAIKKGTTPDTVVKAGRRVLAAGLRLNASILLGAGGRVNKNSHIEQTAAVLKAIGPNTISVKTLTLMPGTPLFKMVKRGEYAHPTPIESTIELRSLIALLELENSFLHTRHPSNAVHISGRLPRDKDKLLFTLDRALNNPTDEFLTTEYFQRGS